MNTRKISKSFIGNNRLALFGDRSQDWYIGCSPSGDGMTAEAPWDDWVRLAHIILAEDKKRI